MNFNKRKEPQIESPPPRIDFAKLAEEIENETTPRVSEYAPAPLRERIEAASRLSMQEMANACEVILAEVQKAWEMAEAQHNRVRRLVEDTTTTVHAALKHSNEQVVHHNENMARIAEVLEQLRDQEKLLAVQPRNGNPKQRKPEEISTDDTPKDAAE